MLAMPSRYKYVRRVKNKWQARVWDGRIRDHVNLGLFDEERAAWDVAKRYALRDEVPDEILPKYVRTHGDLYTARLTCDGITVRVGPCLWPEAARTLLVLALRKRHPALFKRVAEKFPEAAGMVTGKAGRG